VELDRFGRFGDERVVEELTTVRGIGRWTAEMFLMFQLGRIDVWPTGDLGVRNGYARIYALDPAPTPKALEDLGEPHRPYRSVLAWYCWRAMDTMLPTSPAPRRRGSTR
jgi:3-methyladenine DNA glycosylase/8-oxoguanine DNA glycosylase